MDSLADIDASRELDADALARALTFLESTPLSGPGWPVFKRLVRQLELGVEDGFNAPVYGVAIRRLDEEPFDASSRAFWPALGYWKRRGRRFLRKLARAVSPHHDRVAQALLDTVCAGEESLPSHAWISLDLLFGKPRDTSGRGIARRRIEQRRHGRGPVSIVCHLPARRAVLEDRLRAADPAFQAWLECIVAQASRPWEVLEMAVRRLRHAGATVRASSAFIASAARSGSPLLRHVAAKHVVGLEATQGGAAGESAGSLDYATHVQLITGVGSRARRRLEPAFVRQTKVAREAAVATILEQTKHTLFLDRPPKPVRFLIGLLSGPLRDALPADLSTRARDFFGTDLILALTVPGATPALLGRIRDDRGSPVHAVILEHPECRAMQRDLALKWMFQGRLSSAGPGLDELRSHAAIACRRATAHGKQQAQLRREAEQAGRESKNLAWLLATSRRASIRNPPEAVSLAVAACTSSQWRVGWHWNTLAAALAASGRFAEAVVAAEAAAHLDATLATADGSSVVACLRQGRLHPRDELFGTFMPPTAAIPQPLVPAKRGLQYGYVRADDPAAFVIPPRFDEAQPFCSGVAVVRVGGWQGLIDDTGRFVVDPVFERIGPFVDGLSVAATDAGEVLIDRRGQLMTRPQRPRFVGFTRGGSGGDIDTLVVSGAVDSPAFARATTPPPASEVGFAAMHSCQAAAFAPWLDAVCVAPAAYRERALSILEGRAVDVEFEPPEILAMVSHASAWVRNAGWKLVRRSATDTAALEGVWQQVADRGGAWQLDSDEAMALIEESADIAEVAAGLLAEDPAALLAGLADDRDSRRRLARIALHRTRNTSFRRLVDVVGRMEAEAAAAALEAIEAGLRDRVLPWSRVRPLVVHSCEAVRLRGWQLAAAAECTPDFAATATASVGSWKPGSSAWSTALGSGDAIDLLMAGGLATAAPAKAAEVVEAWKDVWRSGRLRLDTLVRLAGNDDAAWQAFRVELLRRARTGGEGVWRGCLEGEAAAGVAGRVAADAEFVEEFSTIDALWPARIIVTPAAPLVKAWLERHGELVAGNPAVLVPLAGSVEPSTRAMAMKMLDRAFVDPATLGRLVETGHPECESLARRILDRYEKPTFEEAVLLLWDSPAAASRRLALEMLAAHRLPIDHALLQRLIETRDAELLAGLARFMNEHAPDGDLRRRYDAAVLRSPWLGRPAKEAVKRRAGQPGAEPVDAATLAALAESPAAVDREWAIARLVEAAARGEPVDGLTIVRESSS